MNNIHNEVSHYIQPKESIAVEFYLYALPYNCGGLYLAGWYEKVPYGRKYEEISERDVKILYTKVLDKLSVYKHLNILATDRAARSDKPLTLANFCETVGFNKIEEFANQNSGRTLRVYSLRPEGQRQ